MKRLLPLLWCFGMLMAQDPLQRQLPLKNNEANQLFEMQELDKARDLYEQLYERDPKNGALAYNLGNVYNAQGDTEKAAELYKQAMTSDNPSAADRGRFNLGTMQMGSQNPQEAVDAFTQYLRNNPDDVDGKRNLELALRMLEQQEQQQNQDQQSEDQENQDQQDQDQQQNQDQQQDQENQDQNQQEQQQNQDQNQQDQDQQNPDQQDQQEQEQDQQEPPDQQDQDKEQQEQERKPEEQEDDSLNEEMKEQILDALNEQELQQQKQYQKRKIGKVKRRAKDW